MNDAGKVGQHESDLLSIVADICGGLHQSRVRR